MSSISALQGLQPPLNLALAHGAPQARSVAAAADDQVPACQRPAPADASVDAPADRHWGCGWFDSSLDLTQGLQVVESDDGGLQWALAQLLFRSAPWPDMRA